MCEDRLLTRYPIHGTLSIVKTESQQIAPPQWDDHYTPEDVQKAVLVERERCLRHVKAISLNAMWSNSPQAICEEIADLIRSGK
jgi:hypothetical protein